jgi:hypothetical protein
VQWDRAPGGAGLQTLAQYGWAGGLRRTRTVRYSSASYPEGRSAFRFDGYGRLTQIEDNVYTSSSAFTTKSKFDYEYDAASNLTKEKYAKANGRVGDRFAYDAYHRLQNAWQGVDQATSTRRTTVSRRRRRPPAVLCRRCTNGKMRRIRRGQATATRR